ncbi:MAG: recombination regulator RecX [Candidatus Symbiothrix sp.]|jgi:regulatory protein|nr:recombination regulator RecX [Candidatus Symbiothrix sp.]
MKQITSEQAFIRLSNYCSRTERCIFDIRRKLMAWEIPGNEQNQIIKKLQQEKFLNESRYCRAFVNDKSKYNRWGAYKIKVELMKKQISEDLIREALENLQPEETLEQLCRLLEQKKKSVKGKNDFEIKQKLMRFAAGRGFSQEDVEKALFILGKNFF